MEALDSVMDKYEYDVNFIIRHSTMPRSTAATKPAATPKGHKVPGPRGSKGEKTKAAIKQAVLRVLARHGYQAMRISDICDEAGVSLGNFYIYFEDKVDVTREVMTEFIERQFGDFYAVPKQASAYAAIYAANQRYIDILEKNGPLNRALGETLYAIPEVRKLWDRTTAEFAAVIARAIARRCPGSAPHEGARLLAAYALQGMLDTVLLSYYAWKNRDIRATTHSAEELCGYLSVLWYRGVYGRDPDPAEVGAGKAMLTLKPRSAN